MRICGYYEIGSPEGAPLDLGRLEKKKDVAGDRARWADGLDLLLLMFRAGVIGK